LVLLSDLSSKTLVRLFALEQFSQVSDPNANHDAKIQPYQRRKEASFYLKEAHFKAYKLFSVGECFGYLPKDATCLPPTCPTRVIKGVSFKVRATVWQDDDCINL